MASPPCILQQLRILPDTPSIAQDDFYWIVAFICKTAATFKAKVPPSPLYFSIPLFLLPQMIKPTTVNTSTMARGLCMSLVVAAPWFTVKAALPMEREGKSRWVVAARAGCCVLCCVVVFCVVFACCDPFLNPFGNHPNQTFPQFLSMISCSNAPSQQM